MQGRACWFSLNVDNDQYGESDFSLVRHEIERYGGTIEPWGDDGFLALFGAEVAQEDHTRRALLASLSLQRLLRQQRMVLGPRQEVKLSIGLGLHAGVVKDGSAPEVEHTYARARELCAQLGEAPQLFPVLWGLWACYHGRGELQTACELGEQLLTIGHRLQDPAFLLQAHRALGTMLYFRGELVTARIHLERSLALYTPQQHGSLAFLYGGSHPGVGCRAYTASALWLLGYPDRAVHRSDEAISLARGLAHRLSLAYALVLSAMLRQFRREGRATQEQAEALMALARDQEFTVYGAMGTLWQSWALAEQGHTEQDMAQMQQTLTGSDVGGEVTWPYWRRSTPRQGRPRRGSGCWPKRWVLCAIEGDIFTRPSCIGS